MIGTGGHTDKWIRLLSSRIITTNLKDAPTSVHFEGLGYNGENGDVLLDENGQVNLGIHNNPEVSKYRRMVEWVDSSGTYDEEDAFILITLNGGIITWSGDYSTLLDPAPRSSTYQVSIPLPFVVVDSVAPEDSKGTANKGLGVMISVSNSGNANVTSNIQCFEGTDLADVIYKSDGFSETFENTYKTDEEKLKAMEASATAEIITSAGSVINIKSNIAHINLFEDIQKTALAGEILIQDSAGFVSEAPIIGQEYLRLKIQTPSLTDEEDIIDFTKNLFVINSVTSRGEVGNNVSVYMLSFSSSEIVKNQRTKVTGSLSGSYSDIVKQMMDRVNCQKKIFIEPTRGVKRIVSPNLNPFAVINMALSSATSSNTFILSNNFSTSTAVFVSKPKSISSAPRDITPSGTLIIPDAIPAIMAVIALVSELCSCGVRSK